MICCKSTPLLPFCFYPFFSSFIPDIFFFSNRKKERKTQRKKNHRKEEKMQMREGAYLSSLAFAFGMKCSSCFLLSTFLER
jgi:hypothetical protein